MKLKLFLSWMFSCTKNWKLLHLFTQSTYIRISPSICVKVAPTSKKVALQILCGYKSLVCMCIGVWGIAGKIAWLQMDNKGLTYAKAQRWVICWFPKIFTFNSFSSVDPDPLLCQKYKQTIYEDNFNAFAQTTYLLIRKRTRCEFDSLDTCKGQGLRMANKTDNWYKSSREL